MDVWSNYFTLCCMNIMTVAIHNLIHKITDEKHLHLNIRNVVCLFLF